MKIAHRALALLPCFALVAGEVGAQVYPAKPVRMVVGFAPGSGTDVVARLVTQKMPEILGQPMLVGSRELQERLIAEGSEPGGVAPEVFAEHIRREIARWAEVVRVSGYTPE